MKAKYNGFCKITNQKIIAGETEIVKINGVWQCEKAESAMTRNSRIKDYVMAPPEDYDWAAAAAEEEAYREAKEAAVSSLHTQFPDVAPEKWRAAINNATEPFGRPVVFTSREKEDAFDKAIANLGQ